MACPDDETLLALIDGRLRDDALASADAHLDSCDSCREIVATLASGSRRRVPSEAGATVGRFVILERLGEGAMGTVLAAYDPELDRRVAIKRLRPGPGGASRRARLTREAQAMARLVHPNVVTVFDVGVEDDELWIAMELVRGQSLRAWLATPRSAAEVLEILMQAGRGLAAAHDAGIVHRDLKPENVLVSTDGAVKVGDFGLAGEEDGASPPMTDSLLAVSLTETGAVLGTPAYMAPEQLAGERASARSDQFAFAVTAWEALEGQRPFAHASSLGALREAIAEGPRPARRSTRPVERALRRALHPDPRARWPSMPDLLAALRPRDARGPWLLGIASSALVAGVVAIPLLRADPCEASGRGIEASWGAGTRATILPTAATTLDAWASRWSGVRVDACRDTHVRHEQSEARLDARMACLDRQRGRFEAIVRALGEDGSLAAIPELLAALPDPESCDATDPTQPLDPATRQAIAEVQGQLDEATVLLAMGRPEEALTMADRAGTGPLVRQHPSLDAEIWLLRADALQALARYDPSLEAGRSALFRAEAAPDARGTALAWLAIVRTHGAAGRFAEASALLPHAEAALERASAPTDLRDALLRTRANVRMGTGALAEARRDLDDALISTRARLGETSLELAPLHTSLGNLARLEERLDDALREHEAALAIDRAALGPEHPRLARDLHNVAGILRRLERRDEAQARYEEALAISTRALGDAHPEAALTRNSLGLLAFEAGDLVVARAHWERALGDLSAHGHGDAALASYNLALLELAEGHTEIAVARARQAIAMDERNVGADAKRVAGEHLVLGRALLQLGRSDEARVAVTRTVDLADELGETELALEARAELAAIPTSMAVVEASPGRAATHGAPRRSPRAPSAEAPAPPPIQPSPSAATVDAADAGVARVQHPAGSGAYGAGVPWE